VQRKRTGRKENLVADTRAPESITLLSVSQIEKLDELVQQLNDYGLDEIYLDGYGEILDSNFARVISNLIGLEKYVQTLQSQVFNKYKVNTE
jgi:folate-dependent phosphoribosylglycinamide formyltransferase PurN